MRLQGTNILLAKLILALSLAGLSFLEWDSNHKTIGLPRDAVFQRPPGNPIEDESPQLVA
jgi:hypothetical protein